MGFLVSELRIGNLVYFNNKHKEVGIVSSVSCEIGDNMVYLNQRIDTYYLEEHIKPIPITEEWLLKAGFVKSKIGIDDKSLKSSISKANRELSSLAKKRINTKIGADDRKFQSATKRVRKKLTGLSKLSSDVTSSMKKLSSKAPPSEQTTRIRYTSWALKNTWTV